MDDSGQPFDERRLKLMHTTMQTLGRVAIIGGGMLVALVNVYLFQPASKDLSADRKVPACIRTGLSDGAGRSRSCRCSGSDSLADQALHCPSSSEKDRRLEQAQAA